MISGTKAGDALLLSYMLGAATPPTFKLRVYSNNHAPAYDDTPSNYTETSITGYAAITLSPGTWTVTPDDPYSHADYPLQTFTFTGGGTEYGYFITDAANTTVFVAELFGTGPFVYGTGGGLLLITPRIGLL